MKHRAFNYLPFQRSVMKYVPKMDSPETVITPKMWKWPILWHCKSHYSNNAVCGAQAHVSLLKHHGVMLGAHSRVLRCPLPKPSCSHSKHTGLMHPCRLVHAGPENLLFTHLFISARIKLNVLLFKTTAKSIKLKHLTGSFTQN